MWWLFFVARPSLRLPFVALLEYMKLRDHE